MKAVTIQNNMAREQLQIIPATSNRDKQRYFQAAFEYIPEAQLRLLQESLPSPDEIGTEADRAHIKAQAYQNALQHPSMGWDDGIYAVINGVRQSFPGADVKPLIVASQAGKPSMGDMLSAFARYFEQFQDPHIVYKRAFCLVDGHNLPLFTTWEQGARIDLTDRDAMIQDYPTSSIAVPYGFDHTFARFTPEEEMRHNMLLSCVMHGLVSESYARSAGVSTGRSFEYNGRIWVFSNPLTQAVCENGIITVSRVQKEGVTVLDSFTDLSVEVRLMAEALEIDPQNIQLHVE